MPRVTKAMLEKRIQRYAMLMDKQDQKIQLLEEKVKLLMSPFTGSGQIASMVIAVERLGDALAHALKDPVIKEIRKEQHIEPTVHI